MFYSFDGGSLGVMTAKKSEKLFDPPPCGLVLGILAGTNPLMFSQLVCVCVCVCVCVFVTSTSGPLRLFMQDVGIRRCRFIS